VVLLPVAPQYPPATPSCQRPFCLTAC
jgi:hypothetical protein